MAIMGCPGAKSIWPPYLHNGQCTCSVFRNHHCDSAVYMKKNTKKQKKQKKNKAKTKNKKKQKQKNKKNRDVNFGLTCR